MQDLDYLLDENGDVDVELCQAIADEAAFQAWRDLPIDNPELYESITKSNEIVEEQRNKDLRKFFIEEQRNKDLRKFFRPKDVSKSFRSNW